MYLSVKNLGSVRKISVVGLVHFTAVTSLQHTAVSGSTIQSALNRRESGLELAADG